MRFATAIQLRDGFTIPTTLPDDPVLLQQMLRAALSEIERQRLIIVALQRNRFGRRSEKLGEAAVQLGIEDLEQAAVLEAAAARAVPPKQDKPARALRTEPVKRNRGALPADLPRVEQVIDIEGKACPCCGGRLHLIGEDRAEMLDYVPAHFQVRAIRRPPIVRSPAAWRPRRCWRMCWSTSTATVCLCIANVERNILPPNTKRRITYGPPRPRFMKRLSTCSRGPRRGHRFYSHSAPSQFCCRAIAFQIRASKEVR